MGSPTSGEVRWNFDADAFFRGKEVLLIEKTPSFEMG
jgi:hypothetical protein